MFAYTVTAQFEDEAVAKEYVAWLVDLKHLQHVIDGGARDAELIRVSPVHLEVRYHFTDEAAFRAYEAGPAIALREDGLKRFPATRGVKMSRATGTTVAKLKGGA
ncbi:MAG: hypothetical protein QM817_01810 [Archangium sp.]